MNELTLFETMDDIPTESPFSLHKLEGKKKELWAIRIDGSNRICFKPAGDFEISDKNEIKMSTVTTIEIHFIGDYHG